MQFLFVGFIALLLLVGAMLVSNTVGTRVVNYLRGIGYYAAAGAGHLPRPTWAQITTALRPIRWIIYSLIGVIVLVWLAFFGTIVGVASAMGNATTGIIIGMLFFVLMVFMVIRRIPGFRTVGRVFFWLILVVIVYQSYHLVSDFAFPGLNGSSSRRFDNAVAGVRNYMDKDSLQSENESGIFGKVSEDVQGMNDAGEPVLSIPKGKIIKVADLDGKKQTRDSEGLVRVMVANRYGNFTKGDECWIPSRIVDWNWKPEKPKPGEFSPGEKIEADFCPDKPGEKKIGRLLPGEYVYEVDGQYIKVFRNDDGPIVGAEGVDIQEEDVIAKIPFPKKKYGVVFIRIGKQYFFPGERFSIERESDVFAEANIARGTAQRNYENRDAVRITVEPAPPMS